MRDDGDTIPSGCADDCGWQGKARNSTGGFTWDTTTIPSGIPALSTYVHSLGLKFGVYSDGGYFACDFVGGSAKYLGSLGHEISDAQSFAAWGADYLKYDNCYAVSETDFVNFNPPIQVKVKMIPKVSGYELIPKFQPHFVSMRDALSATKRPIVFSICEWGVQDLDMLEVGNSGLTIAEQQTHFAFWAAAKSPLIISTDLSKISVDALNILKNPRIIALNQDPLGKSIAFKRRYANDYDVWSGPLADGSTVALLINWQNSARSIAFNLADVGITSATAVDLITGASLGRLTTTYISTVPAHGSVVLKLSGATAAVAPSFIFYDAAASTNTLAGGASNRVVNASISVVGYIGNGGTLTISGVDGGVSGGTKTLSLEYINGDYTFKNNACSNCRHAYISVNGGTAVQVQLPISAQSWDIVATGHLVSLSGFKAGKTNTIQISNPNAYAPDFYRVGVST
ncbi:hypothetical protein H0H81_010545 [Sphagnurus paluster]|uniref:Alpha-galactosidase n=1 Tax=Sphagnurus paluster TaxID=117069 RepID=A0A9P7FWX0_9AGAR|nr:hypothetical protein H0H81_010545 [Sphagnurus paluster]